MINQTGYWSKDIPQKEHSHSNELSEWIANYLNDHKDKQVIDFGCGNGNYLKDLKTAGFTKVLGVEGDPIPNEDVEIIQKDLSSEVDLNKKGVVISLEVGEHIPKEFEGVFLNNLVRHCDDILLLSWAVKGQKGYGHVNELDNNEIIDKLYELGFEYLEEASNEARALITHESYWFRNSFMVFKRIHRPMVDKFDKFYYINLPHRTDRREHVEKVLADLKVPKSKIQRIEATYIPEHPAYGCAISHLSVMIDAKNNKYGRILVFEDDIEIYNYQDMNDKILKFMEDVPDWNGFLGESFILQFDKCDVENVVKIKEAYNSAFYAINEGYVDKLLQNFYGSVQWLRHNRDTPEHGCEKCLDVHWRKLMEVDNWYAFYPTIGGQMETHSDLTNSIRVQIKQVLNLD